MVRIVTSSGPRAVANWGYMLQGDDGRPLDAGALSSATHDLLVIDSSRDGTDAGRFTADEIARIKDGMGGPSVAASYISIGEAADFRDYWNPDWVTGGAASGRPRASAPDWLGPVNPDWPESRKVRYWDPDWQHIVFNDARTGDLDAIVGAGFDAAYLDIVDAYYFWGHEVAASDRQPGDPANEQQAARRMVDFIVAMTEHAREINPRFFVIPQNGGFILDDLGEDPVRRRAYLDAIGGIAVEDLYAPGPADENNRLNPDREQIAVLQRDFLAEGKPVFVVDYLNRPHLVAAFEDRAIRDGFIPYAAPARDLDRLAGSHDGGPALIGPTAGADLLRGSPVRDVIDGLAGHDTIFGRGGADLIHGGRGDDRIFGGEGRDRLHGDAGQDRIDAGAGRDLLAGGRDHDRLAGGGGDDTLAGGEGRDTLLGGHGRDRLDGGPGRDVLIGGPGADVFVFRATPGAGQGDVIRDFRPGEDGIRLDNDAFAGLGAPGTLAAWAFHRGAQAHDASDRVLYDVANGRLFHDADGTGPIAPVPVAQLEAGLALSVGDFGVID